MSDNLGYDEDDAIRFIRKTLPQSMSDAVSDDEILHIIDIIWDWYEKKGYLKITADVTDEEEMNLDELVAYVRKELKRAKEFVMDPDAVPLIVKGEIEYEESIDDFV